MRGAGIEVSQRPQRAHAVARQRHLAFQQFAQRLHTQAQGHEQPARHAQRAQLAAQVVLATRQIGLLRDWRGIDDVEYAAYCLWLFGGQQQGIDHIIRVDQRQGLLTRAHRNPAASQGKRTIGCDALCTGTKNLAWTQDDSRQRMIANRVAYCFFRSELGLCVGAAQLWMRFEGIAFGEHLQWIAACMVQYAH